LNHERWAEIERLFMLAVTMSGEERGRFLRTEIQDAEIRAEVERLLHSAASDEGFLSPPTEPEVAERLTAMSWLIGERVGDYVIESRIGSGGMGVVFKARRFDDGTVAAVKVLYPGSSAHSGERFRREAIAACRLDHPGVAKILSYDDQGSFPYYVMQFVDGWNLRELMDSAIADGPDLADPKTVARLVREAADALHHAHECGVIHRDIKPHNLLVTRATHEIRIIDFGLAKLTALESISRTGDTAGTPLYMSPEQVRSAAGQVDGRTDIYSLGAVLYELLSGSPPFSGSNPQQVLYRIANESPRSLRYAAPNAPAELRVIAAKAMRRDREKRYGNAAAMRDDLSRFLRGESIVARPPSWIERAREYLHSPRRAAFLGAGSTLILAAGLVWMLVHFVTGRSVEAASPTTAVRVSLPRDASGASVRVWRYLPAKDRFLGIAGPVSLPMADLALEDGFYRFTIEVEGGGIGEFERVVKHKEPLHLALDRMPVAPVREGMVLIPGGQYAIRRVDDAGTPRVVAVDVAPFLMDRSEVSNGQYAEFLRAFPEVKPPHPYVFDELHRNQPVIGVSWTDAQRYAEWRGKRLPTALEWKAAAMGLSGQRYPWGEEAGDVAQRAVVSRPRDSDWREGTRDVAEGGEDVSPFGVLHMFGNAYEWTSTPRGVPEGRPETYLDSERRVLGFAWNTSFQGPRAQLDFHAEAAAPLQWSRAGIRLVMSKLD
jgi:formylglycine-generating enzyme required for sulfatase activity